MSKTIGIITMHRVLNWGSMLQAYALQEAIDEIGGYKPEIIDYIYPNIEHYLYIKNSTSRPAKLSSFKRIIRKLKRFSIKHKPSSDDIRNYRFMSFMKDYMHISSHSYRSRYEIDANPPEYDIYLTGSDQVWNPNYIGYDTTFMLGFAPEDKPRIAYAASTAVREFPLQCIKYYKPEISKYSAIALREKTAITPVAELSLVSPTIACDPTILLSRRQWIEKLNITLSEGKEKFFIVYILNYKFNPYPYIYDVIKEAHAKYGGRIAVIHGEIDEYIKSQNPVIATDAGPKEFIQYLSNACFMVTTSFHGTVFALNFEIPFITVTDNDTSKDSRINDLLKQFNAQENAYPLLSHKEISSDTTISAKTISRIAEIRNGSLAWLKENLDKVS